MSGWRKDVDGRKGRTPASLEAWFKKRRHNAETFMRTRTRGSPSWRGPRRHYAGYVCARPNKAVKYPIANGAGHTFFRGPGPGPLCQFDLRRPRFLWLCPMAWHGCPMRCASVAPPPPKHRRSGPRVYSHQRLLFELGWAADKTSRSDHPQNMAQIAGASRPQVGQDGQSTPPAPRPS